MDGPRDGRMDGWMVGWMVGWLDGWMIVRSKLSKLSSLTYDAVVAAACSVVPLLVHRQQIVTGTHANNHRHLLPFFLLSFTTITTPTIIIATLTPMHGQPNPEPRIRGSRGACQTGRRGTMGKKRSSLTHPHTPSHKMGTNKREGNERQEKKREKG